MGIGAELRDVEMKWIVNRKTGERRLYLRKKFSDFRDWHPWEQIPEQDIEEASFQDLRDSGGIVEAP